MFKDLIQSTTEEVRGKEITFHEICADVWLEKVMTDEDPNQDRTQKEIAKANGEYYAKVAAASIAPGVEESFDQLFEEIKDLPAAFVNELFEHADKINGLTERIEKLAGKSPESDTQDN